MLRRLLEVRATDPDDARRRKLLSILLGVVMIGAIAALFWLDPLHVDWNTNEDVWLMLITGVVILAGSLLLYVVNYFWSGKLASFLFLLLLLAAMTFSDTAEQVAAGRSLFVFILPIIISSVLLPSYSSFLFAGASSLIIYFIGANAGVEANVPAILGFFIIALISWLSARSLEQALNELRAINQELDQRVAERTHDLTSSLERERAEAGKNQAILESIADGVLVIDIANQISAANPAIELLLNRPVEGLTGSPANELIGNQDEQDKFNNLLEKAGQKDAVVRLRYGERTLSVNASLVRDTTGKVIGKVAVFRDFTHEAEVEKMKDVFLATVSHELRTPLNAILGYIEMLRESVYGSLTGMQVNITDRIITNTRRLLTIVNDLLDQAQIEAGIVTLHVRNFAASDLVESLYAVMDKIIRDKGLAFECTIDPGLPPVLSGDPERLQQILVNLVGNAVKFTEQGQISVRLYQPSVECWAIEVKDTGCGIPANAQKYIFEPFRQVDPDLTRQNKGIGLGLSIVKNLVGLMRGKINVTSVEQHGSTFTVVLPHLALAE